ncbi:hypothetical protein BGZ58_001319 [Dissophora ornata]|nr:hypothetical protein BGZ58_001319 [Dissophora ornata]
MIATLSFKWWEMTFEYDLACFGSTVKNHSLNASVQINASAPSNPAGDLTPEDMSRRWPYWLLQMLANCLTIAGCSVFLMTKPRTLDDSTGTDRGPSQIWYMSFAILALYLNMLFELRPIKQIGVVVNIILNIAQRIIWFAVIFAVFIIGFT